jgi:hypothetical protein
MAESRPVIRLTLFVPGQRELGRAGLPGEWIDNPNDDSFAEAFSFGTVSEDLAAEIDAAPGALLLQLTNDLREGRDSVLQSVERLSAHGALAIRMEQSKLGWSVERWLEMVGSGNPWVLHRCAVTMLTAEDYVVSCGMHVFSLPDARMQLAGESPEHARELLSALNVYQLAENPLLLSGQTFSPSSETPRRLVQRWPDDGYPEDHWCRNPYGVWRLGPPGGEARPQPELHPQFMPALVVVLAALEEKNGPLTREQVEAATRKASCMAVKHRDAQTLERARGYADIDPELAWEQWCVVRGTRAGSR